MIKNSGELITLAQPLVFIDDLIQLLVEFGGGKYQRYKWLKWHNTVVSYLVALCRASSRNSPIGLAMHLLAKQKHPRCKKKRGQVGSTS